MNEITLDDFFPEENCVGKVFRAATAAKPKRGTHIVCRRCKDRFTRPSNYGQAPVYCSYRCKRDALRDYHRKRNGRPIKET